MKGEMKELNRVLTAIEARSSTHEKSSDPRGMTEPPMSPQEMPTTLEAVEVEGRAIRHPA